MTPEGRVKAKVKRLFKRYEKYLWVDWPVPGGYGKSTLDAIGMCCGAFFAVETKAEGKKPTKLQQALLDDITKKGGKAFVIAGMDSPVLAEMEGWFTLQIMIARGQENAA